MGKVELRHNKILELITQQGRLEVSSLASALGVSSVTMRKDLDALEKKGLIRREHGFAVPCSEDDLSGRLAYHYEEKREIAAVAAGLVADKETIMIENGSCCALLALLLSESKKELTILTNSVFIADYVRDRPGVQVVLLGGVYQPEAQVCVGPLVGLCARNFFVDKFFIGADGYTAGGIFTNKDHMRSAAVMDMAAQAKQVCVLTESEKFSHRGVVPMNLGEKLSHVITDRRIPDDAREELTELGISVLCP